MANRELANGWAVGKEGAFPVPEGTTIVSSDWEFVSGLFSIDGCSSSTVGPTDESVFGPGIPCTKGISFPACTICEA